MSEYVKKNLAFLISTRGQAWAAANVALGINKYMACNIEYDIVVYYDSFSEADIAAFLKIPRVQLQCFSLPDRFQEQMVQRMDNTNRFASPGGLMAFSHYEIFGLLENYRKVCWLDTDMSIQNEISELAAFSGFTITDDAEWPVRTQFYNPIKGYDMDRQGVCTAFIVVDDTLPHRKLYQWCYEKSLEFAEHLLNPDQGIISLALQEFNISPNIIPSNIWQCTPFRPFVHIAKIVHLSEGWKPWNYAALIKKFPEWYRRHLDWLKLGGDDFPNHFSMDLLNRLMPENLDKPFYRIKKIKLFGITFISKEQKTTEKKEAIKFYLFNKVLLAEKIKRHLPKE